MQTEAQRPVNALILYRHERHVVQTLACVFKLRISLVR
jgi:hypothetical protein